MFRIGIAASGVQFARPRDFGMNLVELEIRPDHPRVLSPFREKKSSLKRGLKIQAPRARSRRLIREKRPGKVCGASETPAD